MSAATERRKSKHGRIRQPDLTKLYRYRRDPLHVDQQEFRIMALRPDVHGGPLAIDGMVKTLEWRAEPGDPVLQGTVTVQWPDIGDTKIKLHDGHQLRLDLKWGGRWREVWRMRMYTPEGGGRTLNNEQIWDLYDDGRVLQESRDDWHFTKSAKKGHPKGWLCHEIAREVFRRYRVPVGKIAEGTHYITDLSMTDASPMQVLQRAYAIERRHTKRRFVIRWQNGRANILPMRRNDLMYLLGDTLEDATVGREARDANFATAVTVRATVKQHGSRKRRKIVFQFINEKAVKKEGFVHQPLSGGNVKSQADAETKAKRYIAKHSVRKPTLTDIQHRGIALLRRGDAIRVSLPQQGFHGKQGVCFISRGAWQLSGGEFTMTLAVTFDDPFFTPKERRKAKDKETRKKKRRQ